MPVSIFHIEDGVDLLSVKVPLYISRGWNVVAFPFYGFVQWFQIEADTDLAVFLLCDDKAAHPISWLACSCDDVFLL